MSFPDQSSVWIQLKFYLMFHQEFQNLSTFMDQKNWDVQYLYKTESRQIKHEELPEKSTVDSPVGKLIDKLNSISFAKNIQEKNNHIKSNQIVFGITVDEDGVIVANPRRTIAFNLKLREGTSQIAGKDSSILLAAADADPNCYFVLSLMPSDEVASISPESLIGSAQDIELGGLKKLNLVLGRKDSQPASMAT